MPKVTSDIIVLHFQIQTDHIIDHHIWWDIYYEIYDVIFHFI